MHQQYSQLARRGFLAATAGALAAIAAPAMTEKEKLARVASNTWPIRSIFKTRNTGRANPAADAMKKKIGRAHV